MIELSEEVFLDYSRAADLLWWYVTREQEKNNPSEINSEACELCKKLKEVNHKCV